MYWTNRPYKAICAWEAVQGGRFVQDATATAPAPKKEGKQLVSPHNEHRDTTQKGATECFNAVCHTLPGGTVMNTVQGRTTTVATCVITNVTTLTMLSESYPNM